MYLLFYNHIQISFSILSSKSTLLLSPKIVLNTTLCEANHACVYTYLVIIIIDSLVLKPHLPTVTLPQLIALCD